MSRSVRRAALVVMVLGLGLMTGCVKRSVEGDTSVYTMEGWAIGAVAVGGLVAMPAGWAMRKKVARLGYLLMIVGPLALIFGVPMMWMDRVKVDSEHFERTSGLSADNTSVKFDDLRSIAYVKRRERSGRRRTTKHYFQVVTKSGQTEMISLGTLLQEAAPEIEQRASQKGVAIQAGSDEE